MTTAFKIAMRELRGGLRGFRILILCLMLGVMAIAAVGSVRSAISQGLETKASSLLGGDAEIRFTYRFAEPDERAWMEGIAEQVSEIVNFRSMVTFSVGDERKRALVQVKGVDALYPLYGTVGLTEGSLDQALPEQDGLPGIVAEQVLVDRLGLQTGDILRLGTKDFRLTAVLTEEPDNTSGGFSFGPRVIVELPALADSGLLATGTLFDSHYRLKLAPDANLKALEAEAKERYRDKGLRWRDASGGVPGVGRFVDRMGAFLVLVGLAGLAVGGVGVSAAVRTYLDGKTETIATLKTLGATSRTIFATYLIQIGLLASVGIFAGVILGAALPLVVAPFIADQLPVPAEFGIYPMPLAEAALYGILTALIFSVWPLARSMDIRAAGLFRDAINGRVWPRWPYVLTVLILAGALIGSAAWFSGAAPLALWSAFGIIAALVVLGLAAIATRWVSRQLARSFVTHGRPSLRLALGAISGPGGETVSVVLSLGLGLSVLATIGQIDFNMRNAIEQELPSVAPAFFYVDIQNAQLDEFKEMVNADPGVSDLESAPMLRGIITRINDKPAREVLGDHWVLRGDRGVTYAAEPPANGEITAGEWWDADYTGEPVVSFAAAEGAEMGLELGDRITVNILGRDLTATIVNFRTVDFGNMGINFIMILNPAALQGAPHSHIATVYAEESAEGRLLRDVSDAFPNVTAIRVRDAISQAQTLLEGIGAATRWGALATLVTGFVVLIGAAAAGERRRVFESAILKTLGATRGRILASLALRSAILGLAAGIVAILAGGIAGYSVMTFVMDASFSFALPSAIGIVAGGALASTVAGLLFAMGPLSARPARVLRARE